MMRYYGLVFVSLFVMMAGCKDQSANVAAENPATNPANSLAASKAVKANNAKISNYLDFDDKADFEAADRGFIASFPEGVIKDVNGNVAYDYGVYDFLQNQSPDTANPSLWRQSQLNAKHGLFKVVDGIYQVRGYDLSLIHI